MAKTKSMFTRYQESHTEKNMPCPTEAEIKKDFLELRKIGLSKNDAYLLMALRGGGAMAVQNSDGGGRYPRFLKILRARGFEIYK